MSHVSEGILHAYLDGALDELPGGEADSVRDHLARCTQCSIQLGEAGAVRDEAIAILGGILPPLDMPPLEDLRSRADVVRVEPTGTSGRLYRMGWAASVVLAVGAGWMLRDGEVIPLGMMDPIEVPSARRALLQSLTEELAGLEVTADDEDLVAAAISSTTSSDVVAQAPPDRVREDVERAASPVQETMTDATPRTGLREMTAETPAVFRQFVDSAESGVDQAELPAAEVLPEPLGVSGSQLVAIAPAAERDAAASVLRAEGRRPDVVTSARKAMAGLSLVPSNHSDEEDPDRHVGDAPPFVISGLELIDMSWISEGVTAGGVRVLQELEDGEILELLHLPEGVDPDDLDPFPEDGKAGVITPRDGGWLIMRGNRTVEELQALLERLDGAA